MIAGKKRRAPTSYLRSRNCFAQEALAIFRFLFANTNSTSVFSQNQPVCLAPAFMRLIVSCFLYSSIQQSYLRDFLFLTRGGVLASTLGRKGSRSSAEQLFTN